MDPYQMVMYFTCDQTEVAANVLRNAAEFKIVSASHAPLGPRSVSVLLVISSSDGPALHEHKLNIEARMVSSA